MKKIIAMIFTVLLVATLMPLSQIHAEDDWTDEYYYEVVFTDAYGNRISSEYVKEGESATVPVAPDRQGYRFIGWDKNTTNIHSAMFVHPIYQELNPTPQQSETVKEDKPELCEVTFYDEDTILETRKVDCDKVDKAMPEVLPEKEGYELSGFEKDDDGNLHAKWQLLTLEEEQVIEEVIKTDTDKPARTGRWSIVSLILGLANLFLGYRLLTTKTQIADIYDNTHTEYKHPLLIRMLAVLLAIVSVIIFFTMNGFAKAVWFNASSVIMLAVLLFILMLFVFSFLFEYE